MLFHLFLFIFKELDSLCAAYSVGTILDIP